MESKRVVEFREYKVQFLANWDVMSFVLTLLTLLNPIVCVFVCACMHVCVCVFMSVCMCVCVCVCVFVIYLRGCLWVCECCRVLFVIFCMLVFQRMQELTSILDTPPKAISIKLTRTYIVLVFEYFRTFPSF